MTPETITSVDTSMISRREMIVGSSVGAIGLRVGGLGLFTAFTTTQTACGSTKLLVKWATVALGYLRDLLPILTDAGAAGIVALVNRALPIADKLKQALQDNDNVSTLDALQSLTSPTGIIAQIAEEVGLISDPDKRRIVLGVLAGAQLTLRLVTAQIETDVPDAAAIAVRKARPAAASAVSRAASSKQLEAAFAATRF